MTELQQALAYFIDVCAGGDFNDPENGCAISMVAKLFRVNMDELEAAYIAA